MVAKRSAAGERIQTINQARALILIGPDDLRARHPVGNSGPPEPAQPGPLLPQRTVLILIAALLIGIATGTLTY